MIGIQAFLSECVSEQYKTVTIFPSSERPVADTTGILPAIELTVFPNPSSGPFSLGIKLNKAQTAGIKIFDSFGMCVKNQMVSGLSEYLVEMNLEQYPTGIYFIHVATSTGYAIEKVSIIK
jgi:hypothetical protein